jgi:glycosyltransferase involved in cell wall biosynthesis
MPNGIHLPQNIIMVNDFDYVNGGTSKVAIEWSRILLAQGHNICFFSAVHSDGDKIDGVRYISTNQQECLKDHSIINGAIRGIYNRKAYVELKKLLAEYDPKNTIVYIHGWTKALSSSIWIAASQMGFNIQVTGHDYFIACPNGGFYDYKKQKICHKKPLSCSCICRNCDSRNYGIKIYRCIRQFVQNKVVNILAKTKRIITISDFSEKILKPFLPQNIEIVRIPNPIEKISVPSFDHSKNKFFLFVGRLSQEKGCDLFCKAICELNQKGIVIGDGPELETLQQKYSNVNIKFLGWKKRNEVFEYMRKAKALIFPSRWYETDGLSVREALSIGLPCIVSDCCAAKDHIHSPEDGYVFSSFSDLKETIKKYNEIRLSQG